MLYLCTQAQDIPQWVLERAVQQMPPRRRAQIERYWREEAKRSGVVAWLLLRYGLQQEYGYVLREDFAQQPQGKPYLAALPGVHFNLSHSTDAVACAISTVPVGVDVEQRRPFSDKLCRYVLSDAEYEYMQAAEDAQLAFLQLWTRKESVLKLSGEGLRRDLKTLLDDTAGKVDIITRCCGADIVLSVCSERGGQAQIGMLGPQLCNDWSQLIFAEKQ